MANGAAQTRKRRTVYAFSMIPPGHEMVAEPGDKAE